VQYKDIAELLGIHKQNITDWVKRKKPIPEKRLNDLVAKVPEFKNINKDLFDKELTPMDKQLITSRYLIQDMINHIKNTYGDDDSHSVEEKLDKSIEFNRSAKESIVVARNVKLILTISEHLMDNQEFMNDLHQLIIKHKPELKEILKRRS
jgi:uncharacterized protein YjcR